MQCIFINFRNANDHNAKHRLLPIHEFISVCPEDTAASGGFITGLVKTLLKDGGACLWISWSRQIYPPALKLFGVDPDRVVFIDVPLLKDVLWVTEEALKCEGVAAVICEANQMSFAESQRLQLAVGKSHVTGFVLRKDVKKLNTTACVSRWKITQVPSELRSGMPGVGFPRWQVELLKVHNGNPGRWTVKWSSRCFKLSFLKSPLNNYASMPKRFVSIWFRHLLTDWKTIRQPSLNTES